MASSNLYMFVLFVFLALVSIHTTTTLQCTTSNSCAESRKLCNNNEKCIIQCIGKGVCTNAQFTCPTNNDCTLICESQGSSMPPCKNIRLIAYNSSNTDVSVICSNTFSCQNVLVNASNVNNLIVISNQTQSGRDNDTVTVIIYAEYIKNNVNITCDGDNTCHKLVIYANYSNHINIIATGANTLQSSNIYAYYASSFKLSCNCMDKIGCNYPSLYLPLSSSSNIELNCTGLGCKTLILYTMNGFSDINTLSINCQSHSCKNIHSCMYLWIMHCHSSHSTQSSTNLFDGSYCDNSNCQCMDYGLKLIQNAWESNNILCNAYNTTIICENGLKCNINCSQSNYHCSNALINALDAKSVNITCLSNRHCDSLIVYCPKGNGVCNLMCLYHGSCDKALLYATNGDAIINIYCHNTYSCNSMEIHAYNSSNTALFCEGSNACNGLTLYATNSDNILVVCDYSSSTSNYISSSPCYSATIHGENANTLQVQCNANYSCCNNYIFAQNSQRLLVTAHGDHSLYAPYIYAQNADNFTLTCIGYDVYFGCQQLLLYIEGSSTNINCIAFGCQTLTIYDKNIANDIDKISVIGDCDSCNDTFSCIIQWDIKCAATKQDYFDGMLCESNDCSCLDLQTKVENGWKYIISEKEDECFQHNKKRYKKTAISWKVIICIIVSVFIIFVVIVSIYMCYNTKKQKINHMEIAEEPVSNSLELTSTLFVT